MAVSEGTATEVRPGHWRLRCYHNGVRKEHRCRAANEDVALTLLAAWRAELAEQLGSRSTFAELLELYYTRRSHRNEASSNRTMRQRIDDHLIPLAGLWVIEEIGEAELEGLYGGLRAKGLGRETVRKIHYIVRPALELAVRKQLITHNPANVDVSELLGAAVNYQADAPALEALTTIYMLASARGLLDVCLYVRVLILTAFRRGEACGLRWGDVDWEGHTLRIVRAIVVVRGKIVVTPGKGKRKRTVAVDRCMMDALAEYRDLVIAGGGDVSADAYIFADFDKALDGSIPVKPATWTSRWDRLRRKAGVTVRMHDLRHGSLSWLMAAQMNPVDVARRAGHSKTSTTTDTYGHAVVPTADRDAAAHLSERFAAVSGEPVRPARPLEPVPRAAHEVPAPDRASDVPMVVRVTGLVLDQPSIAPDPPTSWQDLEGTERTFWRRVAAVDQWRATGSLQAAAAVVGVSPTSVHNWARSYDEGGLDALKVVPQRRPTTSPALMAAVLALAVEQPQLGCKAMVPALAARGVRTSKSTVARILADHGLASRSLREAAASREQKVAA